MFVSAVAKYAGDQEGSSPLGDWYETTNGTDEAFKARPVVGGHLALVSHDSHFLIRTKNERIVPLIRSHQSHFMILGRFF